MQVAGAPSAVSSQGRGSVDSNTSHSPYSSCCVSPCKVCSHLLTSLAACAELKGLGACMLGGKVGSRGCGMLNVSMGLPLQGEQAAPISKRGPILRKVTGGFTDLS